MCPPAVTEVPPDSGTACIQVCADVARCGVGSVNREVAIRTAGNNSCYGRHNAFAVYRPELQVRGDGDVVGFRVIFEAELAGGVIAEGEDAAGVVEHERVVVACCNLRNGEALEGG